MNGPQHFLEAERLIASASRAEGGSAFEHYSLAAAQVHATLAQAAATATLAELFAIHADVNHTHIDAWDAATAAATALDAEAEAEFAADTEGQR